MRNREMALDSIIGAATGTMLAFGGLTAWLLITMNNNRMSGHEQELVVGIVFSACAVLGGITGCAISAANNFWGNAAGLQTPLIDAHPLETQNDPENEMRPSV